jgi:diguanylate cyclase (GGDEF)-like protein/PAS domain S-box-containing protein
MPQFREISKRLSPDLTIALRTAALYAAAAGTWITLSDLLVWSLIKAPADFAYVEQWKGWAFIAVTATFLFFMVRRSTRRLIAARERLHISEREYRLLFEANPQPMWVFSTENLAFLAVNDAALQHYGYSREEFLAMTLNDVYPPEDVPELQRRLSENQPWPARGKAGHHRKKDGSLMEVEVVNHWLVFQDKPACVMLVQNVTEHRRTRRHLQLVAQAFESARDSILITDVKGTILAANKAFTKMTGYTEAEVLGRTSNSLAPDSHDEKLYDEIKNALVSKGYWEGEILSRRKDGSLYSEKLSVTVVYDEASLPTAFVAVANDISERKQVEEQIHNLANYDPVTRLPNRSLLADRGKAATAFCQRVGKKMAVFYIDVDHFKNVNESLGHVVGDHLLGAIAERLKSVVRTSDTIARWSADEFVLVLIDTDKNGAEAMAKRIQAALARPFEVEDRALAVGVTIGIATFPSDGEDLDSLIRNADIAARYAKDQGRGRYFFFAPEMSADATERLMLESALREAIQRNELHLHYQPQIDMETGRIVGVEALLRWRHPQLGNIPPVKFIPIAESTGLIVEIGAWVMRTACHQNRQWRDTGVADITVAVNLSAPQIRGGTIVEDVRRTLEETGLPPGNLELELTESLLLDDAETTLAQFQTLKDMGVKLSIDDFGTGYSNLSYLNRFPAHKLKIDQSFIRNMLEREGDQMIVQAIISLGHGLKLTVIAEGVETDPHAQLLSRLRCDEAQGYLYARPMPAADIPGWIESRATLPSTIF